MQRRIPGVRVCRLLLGFGAESMMADGEVTAGRKDAMPTGFTLSQIGTTAPDPEGMFDALLTGGGTSTARAGRRDHQRGPRQVWQRDRSFKDEVRDGCLVAGPVVAAVARKRGPAGTAACAGRGLTPP
jgi:hypothetical protein